MPRVLLALAMCAVPGMVMAEDPPLIRLDVVTATNGVCNYAYSLSANEVRLVYCDLAALPIRRFSAVAESGSFTVLGYVSDVFETPAGVIMVLRNQVNRAQTGVAKISPFDTFERVPRGSP
ncbi:MAG: hypothetical protein SGI99_11480 [Pseudomonadota bacterium]|nr:hypothetical protein [Pseudomonadota bacterium]